MSQEKHSYADPRTHIRPYLLFTNSSRESLLVMGRLRVTMILWLMFLSHVLGAIDEFGEFTQIAEGGKSFFLL